MGVPMDQPMVSIKIGEAELLQEGSEITIIAIGTMVQEAIKAARALAAEGISVETINARFVKPLDKQRIVASAKKTMNVITVEENALMGGFGSAVEEMLEESGVKANVIRIGIPDEFIEQGSQDVLKGNIGLNTEGIFYHAKYLAKCKALNMAACSDECKKKNQCGITVKAK